MPLIKKLRVTVDGKPYEVSVELSDEAAPTALSAAAPAAPATPAAAAPAPAAAVPAPPPPTAPAAPTATASGPGDVASPLTGRVTAVVATVGGQVAEGDHLLTLEAMKMNTFVFAPKAGKVAEIKVAVGDAVEEHQVLARIG